MRTKQLMALMGGIVLAGCVADEMPGEGDEAVIEEVELGETTQAITDWMYYWHSANWEDGYELDLGSSSDKTCFIAGIKGSLKGWYSYSSSSYKTARAEVVDTGGKWKARTSFGYGNGVAVKVACVANTTNRVAFGATFHGNNDVSTSYVPATANRKCFISSIRGRGHGWTAWLNEQPNGPPGVSIYSDGINLRFVGNVVDHVDSTWSAGATAVCFDVADGAYQSWNVSTPTTNKILSSGTYACGLERISGVFDDPTTTTGIELYKSGSDTWRLDVGPHHGTRVGCVH